jgi:hypothetical protein
MRVTIVEFFQPGVTLDHLGLLPEILQAGDPRPVAEQLADRYAHGGGYRPMGSGDWHFDEDTLALEYPGDEPYRPVARFTFPRTNEIAILYEPCSFLLIKKQDSKHFVVTRVD